MRHILITGPTASGKTELALTLARQWHTDIISADSRQVYQSLTVGTAKPVGHWENSQYLTENIAYHLVDFLSPDQTFNAASFCQQANQICQQQPTKPFIFAGGTGLYLHALFIGLDPLPPSSDILRAELTQFATIHGKEALHKRLAEQDPLSAQQIPPGNIQRVMRALEISLLAGTPASSLRTHSFDGMFPKEKALLVYICWDKDLLHQRILQRTQAMLEPMAEETRQLLAQGFSPDCPALKSLGYPQIIDWLKGNLTREETLEKIVVLTRQYAKRQRTWFNRYCNALRIHITRAEDFKPDQLANQIIAQYQQEL